MTSRMTGDMTDDVSKRMNMSILSEVMLAVVQRSERNEHTVSYIAIHTRGRWMLFFQFMNSEINCMIVLLLYMAYTYDRIINCMVALLFRAS